MSVFSVAFVGAVGGAGTTRTVVELGGVLARGGRSALVLDLDFATQGLSRYLEARPDPDATALLADPDVALEDTIHEFQVSGNGRLGVSPSFSPFAGTAEAKTPEAGARIAERLEEAEAHVDHVLLDVPPVVSNQAIGAVTAADRVVAVIPSTDRGVDSLQRERGRLADVGSGLDLVVAVDATTDSVPPDADHVVPSLPRGAPENRPTTGSARGSFTDQVATVAESVFDVDLAERVDAAPSVLGRARKRLGR